MGRTVRSEIWSCAKGNWVLQSLEVGFGGFEFGEETLFGLELAGVNAAAAGL